MFESEGRRLLRERGQEKRDEVDVKDCGRKVALRLVTRIAGICCYLILCRCLKAKENPMYYALISHFVQMFEGEG